MSNISSVYVTPAAPVFPPVPRDDVHLSFRLWYEGVASSSKGAGGGRSPVVANTVELQKNDNKTVAQLDGYCHMGELTRPILSLNFNRIDRKAVANLLGKTSSYLCCPTATVGIFRQFSVLHCNPSPPYTPAWCCGDYRIYSNKRRPSISVASGTKKLISAALE